ncbi:MAG: carboxypeptidase-like regulatory domain-containing protein [Bacteroidota bacterium]
MKLSVVPLAFVLLMSLTFSANAQDEVWSASGQVINASGKIGLVGATVMMINIKDSTQRYAVTGNDGSFTIDNLEKAFYRLQVSSVGYKMHQRMLRITLPEVDLGTLSLD